jgi:hypothetical protein
MKVLASRQSVAMPQRMGMISSKKPLESGFMTGHAPGFKGMQLRQTVHQVASCRNVTVMAAKGTQHSTLYYIGYINTNHRISLPLDT